ncbi:MAG: futalosine hydrolase [Nitrospirota bacterium]|jgi:futalosine hydrolase
MPKGKSIGLISSVPFESSLLLGEMKSRKTLSPSISTGRVGGARVVHITSGMGIANAAWAATVLCERFAPSEAVVFGVGGAYPGSGLATGDVALAEREVYADAGVLTEDGLKGLEEIGIELLRKGGRKYFNEFPMDGRLLRRASRLLEGAGAGVFATVNASTGTMDRASEIVERYGAVCENMEGAAVAQVCKRYGVPVLELRGISNVIPERDRGKWALELASEECQRALIRLAGVS